MSEIIKQFVVYRLKYFLCSWLMKNQNFRYKSLINKIYNVLNLLDRYISITIILKYCYYEINQSLKFILYLKKYLNIKNK